MKKKYYLSWITTLLMLFGTVLSVNAALEAPKNIDIVADSTNASISWDEVLGADSYKVEICRTLLTLDDFEPPVETDAGRTYTKNPDGSITLDGKGHCNLTSSDDNLNLSGATIGIVIHITKQSNVEVKVGTSTVLKLNGSSAGVGWHVLEFKVPEDYKSSGKDFVTIDFNNNFQGTIYAVEVVENVTSPSSPSQECINSVDNSDRIAVNGTTATVNGLVPGNNYTVKVTPIKGNEEGAVGADTFVTCRGRFSTIWTGKESSAWDDVENWNGGAPCLCADVIISSVEDMDNYPIISAPAYCNDITFEPTAGVNGLEHLTYNRAFVKLRVDKREHWYTMAAPLQGMVSGDFYFEGKPIAYMQKFSTNKTSKYGDTEYSGGFDLSFKNLNVSLPPGEGFAFKLSEKGWISTGNSEKSINPMLLTFPRLDSNGNVITEYKKYNSLTGKVMSSGTTITRNGNPFRFSMEEVDNNPISLNNNEFKLVGNPMMSYLDFKEFCSCDNNEDLIEDHAYFWNGTIYELIYIDGDGDASYLDGGEASSLIPPMQSFVVKTKNSGTLKFQPANHYPKENVGLAEIKGVRLRSTKEKPNKLFVSIGEGDNENKIIIAKSSSTDNGFGKGDIEKLFAPDANSHEIYSLVEGKFLNVNTFKEAPYSAAIGIRSALNSNEDESATLRFRGVESFDDDVILINTLTGEEVNLKEESTYQTKVSNLVENRIFVEFRKTDLTSSNQINNTDKNTIQIL